ncbi:hypothetical protein [Nocardioides antri]|uniref:Apea-like HEPN domain-containing protein n=1 Tax=Nocardioides antri TaxID=2607659 RepID=A0A5B1M2F4_9ACTN|nr:hypothetical protein [Nocardioides antri]KAA1426901.1 hypothetical protein F0U47_12020 [Nocardioides antri]
MKRLPAVVGLADEIRGKGKNSPEKSADYLLRNRAELRTYPSVDVLAMYSDPEYAPSTATPGDIKKAKALVHHFTQVRSAIAQALWSREIFIGIDVIDELAFHGAQDNNVTDLLLECLTRIRDGRMNRPGLIIFPVHSFGVLSAGLFYPLRRGQLTIVNPDSGYALFPQSNDMGRTFGQLQRAAERLGVNKSLPRDLLEHWRLSRGAEWLERNPLLVVRANHLPGSYYANEHLLMNRVQSVVGLLSLLAALQPATTDRAGFLMSSSRTNNWETLDIHHYLALYDPPAHKTELAGDCVPIHGGRVEVSEMAALGFDLDPTYWRRQVALGADMQAQVEKLYIAQLKLKVAGKRLNAPGRTVNRLFDSLQMFRRSFADSADDWTGRVALSTAFETLLTDHYGKVRATLMSRCKELMRGQRGTRAMQQAVGDLYASRSELVHGAEQTTSADMYLARRAYALCFLALSKRIDQIPTVTSTPVGDVVDN